jgi:hypothetical protein
LATTETPATTETEKITETAVTTGLAITTDSPTNTLADGTGSIGGDKTPQSYGETGTSDGGWSLVAIIGALLGAIAVLVALIWFIIAGRKKQGAEEVDA